MTSRQIRWPDVAISMLFYLGLAGLAMTRVLELFAAATENRFLPVLLLGAFVYPLVFSAFLYKWTGGGGEDEVEALPRVRGRVRSEAEHEEMARPPRTQW